MKVKWQLDSAQYYQRALIIECEKITPFIAIEVATDFLSEPQDECITIFLFAQYKDQEMSPWILHTHESRWRHTGGDLWHCSLKKGGLRQHIAIISRMNTYREGSELDIEVFPDKTKLGSRLCTMMYNYRHKDHPEIEERWRMEEEAVLKGGAL